MQPTTKQAIPDTAIPKSRVGNVISSDTTPEAMSHHNATTDGGKPLRPTAWLLLVDRSGSESDYSTDKIRWEV